MNTPSVTVLMPVHNAERYVAKAIESILSQTFTDYEFIIIDDGSMDNSLDIIQDYADKDERIRLISRENKGLVATLNEGIELANAPLLARMDADDICLPVRFEKQVNFLKENPECVVVGSRVLFIDEDDGPLMLSSPEYAHAEIDEAHLTAKSQGAQICHPVAMIRMSALKKVGVYNFAYKHAEDIDLFLRLAEVGSLVNLHEVLLKYRQHFSQVCFMHKSQQLENVKKSIDAACSRRGIAVPIEINDVCDSNSEVPEYSDVHRKWGWWALSGGYQATARKHAIKAFLSRPLNIENIRLLVCAVRGY